jgi:protein involved in polysaccharide export with SLBB domain
MKRSIILSIWQVLFLTIFMTPMVYADFGLMLGSFKDRGNAQKYLENFIRGQDGAKENVFLEDIQMPGKGTWYRVCLGPFGIRSDAVRRQKAFQSKGHDSVIVSVNPINILSPNFKKGDSKGLPESVNSDANSKRNPPLIPENASGARDIHDQTGSRQNDEASSYSPPKRLSQPNPTKTQTDSQVKQVSSSKSPTTAPVIVSAGDIINIEIPGQEQMSRDYDLDPDGKVYMMSVGEINIGGLDISNAEKKAAKLLRQIIPKEENPVIKLVESKRYINISGGVNYPGWYRVPRVSNLDDLVEMAGGVVAGVDFSGIKLRRSTKSGITEIKVKALIALDPNDVLMVPTPKTFERKVDSGDLLFINIPEKQVEAGLSEIERRVSQNKIEVDKSGYIYIPNYGHIYVKNLLPTEISKIISSRLPKYLARSAKVHVNIIEKRQYVQVGGHVAKPGWYNIPESNNIQAALGAAGGAVDGAIMSRVVVTRKWGGRTHHVRINLYQFTVTGDVRLLTPVQENDSLFVPISSAFGDVKRTLSQWQPPPSKLEEDTGSKVRIFGAVANPGVYEPKEDMSILDLLILAGGNRDDADLAKTMLIRENKTETFDLNYLIIQSTQGAAKIPEVQNGDSVYVSFVKKAGYEKQEPKKMVRIFGAVKKPGIYDPAPDMDLMDILSLADGQQYDADLTKIVISRTNGSIERFDMQEYFDAKNPDPTKLPKVYESDTVYVHYLQHLNLEKKQPIYLLGKVLTPGQYDLAEGNMTVYQMIAYAGGLDEWADTENIMIIRMVSGRQRNIPYNLRKALSGKYPELNIRLRTFDTIYVP